MKRTHVCKLTGVNLGHLQNNDPGAYNGKGKDNRDDLRCASLQALVQDDGGDQGTEGNCR